MSFSSLIYRGVCVLCKPFVKLNNKMESRLQENAKKKENVTIEKFSYANKVDPFFSKIGVITHAGGGLQGLAYLNCEQAFSVYYNNGNRVFEYDIDVDSSGKFILSHTDGNEDYLDGRFTPLSIEKCLDNIKNYADITVIFDSKFKDLTEFSKYVKEYLKEEKHLNRVVIQVFNEENILQVKSVYDFKVLHVCMMDSNYYEVTKTCIKYNVGAVSISVKALNEKRGQEIFALNNICAFAYTVNTIKEARKLKEKGISGIFSDFLFDKDLVKAGLKNESD